MSSNKKTTKTPSPSPPPAAAATTAAAATAPSKPKTSAAPAISTPKANAWSKPLKTVAKATGQNTPPARQNSSTPPPPPPGYKAKDVTSANLDPLTINGTTNKKSAEMPSMSAAEQQQLRFAHRERALHIWLNLVGTKVVLHLTDKTIIEGIFHTATPLPVAAPEQRNKYVIKAVRVIEKGTEHGEMGVANGSTLVIDMSKVVQMHVKSLPKAATMNGSQQQPTSRNAFTDTEISGAKSAASDKRDLQEAGTAWISAPPPATKNYSNVASIKPVLNSRAEALGGGATNNSAPEKAGLSGSIEGWDQFRANEKLFNVKGSYDESIYTTQLDKKALPANAIAKAEKLAKEIEGTVSTNFHLAEERNQKIQGDYDEEDLYSGVLKDPKGAKKTVPATPDDTTSTLSYAKVAKASEEKEPSRSPAAVAASTQVVVTPEQRPRSKGTPVAGKEKEPAPDSKQTQKGEGQNQSESKKAEESADDKDEDAPKSKLNANAKEFTLNINAPSFTPKFGGAPTTAESHAQQSQVPMSMDSNNGIPVHMPQGGTGSSPYVQPQQGMIPIMAPQYVRYPGTSSPYNGVEHPQQQQQHPMHIQQITVTHHGVPTSSARTSETASPIPADSGASVEANLPVEDDDPLGGPGLDPDAAGVHQQPNPQSGPMQQQHPGMQQPMAYGMPQQGYYNPQMSMPHRGPVPGYPQHMMPQQIPNPMYRQVYQMPGPHPGMMAQAMPGPYYNGPGGPMGYPNYGYDDEMGYRGGGGGNGGGNRDHGGRGRGGRGRGRGGRGGRHGGERNAGGRGRYSPRHHFSHGGSGRNTPQQDDGGQRQHQHYNNNHHPHSTGDSNEVSQPESQPQQPPLETTE